MKDEEHPIAATLRQLEKRHQASAAKAAELWKLLGKTRDERDEMIRADPEASPTVVGRRFGVSPTWVKKVRKKATEQKENP